MKLDNIRGEQEVMGGIMKFSARRNIKNITLQLAQQKDVNILQKTSGGQYFRLNGITPRGYR
jgi:hypothetical protein